MIAPSIGIVFDRKCRASKTTRGAVEVRVTFRRQSKYFATGVRICSHQWREGKVVAVTEAMAMNAQVSAVYERVMEIVREQIAAGEVSLDVLAARMQEQERKFSPVEWVEHWAAEGGLRPNTARRYLLVARRMRSAGLFSSWAMCTAEEVERFDRWLRVHTGIVSPSGLRDYHKVLRVCFNRARRAGLLGVDPYLYLKVERPSMQATVRYLTDEERVAVVNASLKGAAARVRDVYVFAMYTGLAWVDLQALTDESFTEEDGVWYVSGRRTKTGAAFRVPLLAKALEVAQRYRWRLPVASNQKMNYQLKRVAAAAGLTKPLTMHMARHTFATWALRHGVPLKAVSTLLAHRSVAVTEIYAKLLQADVDAALLSLDGENGVKG